MPTVEVPDAPEDCLDGFGNPTACAGLDMLAVWIGSSSQLPELGSSAPAGRLGFVIQLAEPVAPDQSIQICLALNRDTGPATGLAESNAPGLDRRICVEVPTASVFTVDKFGEGYDRERVGDPALMSARSMASGWVSGPIPVCSLTQAESSQMDSAWLSGPPAASPS